MQRRVNKSWPLAACVLLFSCSEKRDTSADSAPGGADSADSAAGDARFSVVGESLSSATASTADARSPASRSALGLPTPRVLLREGRGPARGTSSTPRLDSGSSCAATAAGAAVLWP